MWPTALRHGGTFSIPRSHAVWNETHPNDVVQPGEHVHHENGIRDDDRAENLRRMDAAEHEGMHGRAARRSRDAAGRFAA
ncbi:HNH endonuclease [Gaiella occulta]|uniref:HNH endonuclease n=2 Tax=Gaiella occulta TaxID=1002870 RepID=A0A7M2YUM3_9ACTN|nr:HNH endonuclease [Gaiella occulta]